MLATLMGWWAIGKAKAAVYALGALLVVAAFGFVYYLGWSAARDRCNTAALRGRIATLESDLIVIRNAALDDRRKSEEDAAMSEEHRKIINDLEEELKKRPDSACVVTPSDVGRVRK